jgi:hypothetical protein
MNFDDARRFVQQMREDTAFRRSVAGFGASSELWDFLKRSGFDFGPCDLVKAMAACMAASENTTGKGIHGTKRKPSRRRSTWEPEHR